MSMVIANNIPAINTQRQFAGSGRGMSSAMEKLSSGYKINTGKDDPSGLTISEQLRSQINGLKRAQQNTEEAINVMTIAEGAMNEMNSILKKMKALAIHANNNGVTSPDQVAADQAELDSGIQTLDRIAQTTKFADQQLINGNKDLSFEQDTGVTGTQQNKLLVHNMSKFSQIFKRDMEVSISFNGSTGNIAAGAAPGVTGTKLTGDGKDVVFANQAQKGYFEVDSNTALAASELGSNGKFLHAQQFTLTGNKGSRSFNIAKGATVGELVKQINTASDATGVKAALVFNSEQRITKLDAAFASDPTIARNAGAVHIFGNNLVNDNGDATSIFTAATPANANVVQFGRNTDGQGNVYVKFIDENRIELYKDASMSKESLIATASDNGAGLFTTKSVNNSGLDDIAIQLNTTLSAAQEASLANHKGMYINFGGLEVNAGNFITPADPSTNTSGVIMSGDLFNSTGTPNPVSFDNNGNNLFTGVELGQNTSEEGKLFLKMVVADDGTSMVYAYKHESMEDKYLVGKSDKITDSAQQVTINELRNDDKTAGTGLGIVLGTLGGGPRTIANAGTYTGVVQFSNVGARVYADEYGSDQYVKIQQEKGNIFSYYETAGSSQKKLVEAGTTRKNNGQDATLSVNGTQVKTTGLKLDMANQDFQANFVFNEGKVGSTTIAQVGYGTGSVFAKIGALNIGSNNEINDVANPTNDDYLSAYLCNAGHSTTEKLKGFDGGMQLQLGESAGSNDRTIVAARSMTSENLGKVSKWGYYDSEAPTVLTEKTFTLKDCFGGRQASLSVNADLAIEIIDVAVKDVASQRATLGAMQSNLLQTNSNNLSVTVENIQKTESGIRDADMAVEMTEFTKNQVLQNAAMSMMSQANQASQNILQLLR